MSSLLRGFSLLLLPLCGWLAGCLFTGGVWRNIYHLACSSC